MNAHQKRIEKRRRARSQYPAWTDFKPVQLFYGMLPKGMGMGIYRADGDLITHCWVDYDVSTEEEIAKYHAYVASEGYKGPTKMNVVPKPAPGELE